MLDHDLPGWSEPRHVVWRTVVDPEHVQWRNGSPSDLQAWDALTAIVGGRVREACRFDVLPVYDAPRLQVRPTLVAETPYAVPYQRLFIAVLELDLGNRASEARLVQRPLGASVRLVRWTCVGSA